MLADLASFISYFPFDLEYAIIAFHHTVYTIAKINMLTHDPFLVQFLMKDTEEGHRTNDLLGRGPVWSYFPR